MLIEIKTVKPRYDGHKTLIIAIRRRRWFEIWLISTKPHTIIFIGHGTKWWTYPKHQIVPAKICKQLQQVEERHSKTFIY